MLPNINKRRKLYGLDRKKYDDAMLHRLYGLQSNDGCANKNSIEIVQKLNDYFDRSLYLMIQMSVIFTYLDKTARGECCISEYNSADNMAICGRYARNIMGVIKSVSKQRHLFLGVKRKVKINKLDSEWFDMLNQQIAKLEERLNYIENITPPINLKPTPLALYASILEEDGKTLYEDISKNIPYRGDIFDDIKNDPRVVKYMKHIDRTINKRSSDKQIIALLNANNDAVKREEKRAIMQKKMKDDEVDKKYKDAVENAHDFALQLCGIANKRFATYRSRSLTHHAKARSVVYVVVAYSVKRSSSGKIYSRCGYLNKAKRWYVTLNENRARIFLTEEAANAAIEGFNTSKHHPENESYEAFTAEIELWPVKSI